MSRRGKRAAYAPALKQGLVATTTRVQEMHLAIAGKTFDALQRVPVLALPARAVQGAHDVITHGVYAAVRQGGAALLAAAGEAECHLADAERSPQGAELALRSVLNAAFGDSLQAAQSALATAMSFHSESGSVELTPDALDGLGKRVCVFVHGLGCDEQSWLQPGNAWAGTRWAGQGRGYGTLLARELGIGSLYLRYNTGLSVADNGAEMATQLQRLVDAAPAPIDELVMIGHSMGGLVARSAHAAALARGLEWPARSTLMICLGSPHQGAPLEKIGHLAEAALGLSTVTKPLARIAKARSRGIKDLRHGVAGQAPAVASSGLALRLVAGSLADESAHPVKAWFGGLIGDGLVRTASAVDAGLTGDVQRVELASVGHMALLNHPRVYALLRGWLGAA